MLCIYHENSVCDMMMIAINSHDSASIASTYVVCDPVGGDTLPAQPSQHANSLLCLCLQKSADLIPHCLYDACERRLVAVIWEVVLPSLISGRIWIVATCPEHFCRCKGDW